MPGIPDTGPRASAGDRCLVNFIGNHKYPHVGLQAAKETLPPDEEEEMKKKKKKKKKNKNKNRNRNMKKKKEEEAMRKEEHKKEGEDAIINMAQINGKEWCKATANVENTRGHNVAFPTAQSSPGLPASTVLDESPVETSQEPLILSTYQLHTQQGLILSPTEEEQILVYQRAIEGMKHRNGRHVIILTTLPNMDQGARSSVQCVRTAQEFIGTKVKDGIITLRQWNEDEVEVTNEVIETLEDLSKWNEMWELIETEVEDKVKDELEDKVEDKVEDEEKDMKGEVECEVNGKTMRNNEGRTRKVRHAIPRHLVLTRLWTAIYNLIFRPNTLQRHIEIDQERQLSSQYCSFPRRSRSRLIPTLKVLRLAIFLFLACLIGVFCSDGSLSGVHD